MVNATDSYGRNLVFLHRRRYYFFQVGSDLYSRDRIDPVLDPLLLRKSGNAGNRTRDLWICKQELRPLDHLYRIQPNLSLSVRILLRV
jgi:hypothetical protein